MERPSLFYADRPEDLITVDAARSMSGLELFEALLAGRVAGPPIGRTLNFHLADATHGRAVFEGKPDFAHYNPMGAVHGGWFGAVLDSCMSCAVHTTLSKGMGYTTLEYRVNVTRPLFRDSEPVRAIGETLHVGKRTGTAEGKIVGVDSGKLYAFGTATCLLIEL